MKDGNNRFSLKKVLLGQVDGEGRLRLCGTNDECHRRASEARDSYGICREKYSLLDMFGIIHIFSFESSLIKYVPDLLLYMNYADSSVHPGQGDVLCSEVKLKFCVFKYILFF